MLIADKAPNTVISDRLNCSCDIERETTSAIERTLLTGRPVSELSHGSSADDRRSPIGLLFGQNSFAIDSLMITTPDA